MKRPTEAEKDKFRREQHERWGRVKLLADESAVKNLGTIEVSIASSYVSSWRGKRPKSTRAPEPRAKVLMLLAEELGAESWPELKAALIERHYRGTLEDLHLWTQPPRPPLELCRVDPEKEQLVFIDGNDLEEAEITWPFDAARQAFRKRFSPD